MDDKCEGRLRDLEKDYCPPLDPALFTAIASDFDLSDSAQLQQLRETLDTLKLTAWEQEDLPFDPSGTSGLDATGGDVDGIPSEKSLSQNGTRETDITSLTSGFSGVSLGDRSSQNSKSRSVSGRVAYIIAADGSLSLSGATEDDKVGYLSEMFPSMDQFTIQHALRKSSWDVDRSMDVLLNLTFFNEQLPSEDGTAVAIPKGIDGFEDGDTGRKKNRKRKAKHKHGRNQDFSSHLDADADFADGPNTVNKWNVAQKDVDFIHSRTSPVLKKETVTSAYHANGASLTATIRSLAEMHAPHDERSISQDPVTETQVAELTQELPSVPPTMFAGLLKITRGSVSAASELAAAMLTGPMTPSVSELIKITTSPPPVDVEDETPQRRTAVSRVPRDYDRVRSSAGAHFAASAEALSKASAAYRRGRSDRLMGGAAAYYSAVGRDHLERAKRNAAAASDALVDSQSTSTMLDLHGVSVQDAVRIASERVSGWWESLGDAKYIRGGEVARSGYRIVTGLGRHSHDGTSRLGPAVGKMLAREGWRVEVGEGVLTVIGVVRRR
ncbi:hypothetical protein BDV25DRAFT_155583 [Aspergillus avenaceus]|uniref:Smr domain protein n=1 Tax=Aspergillus avenaceus TaxID=36643 RepID=A0A5N6TUN7_ASPAV|nr:hypothetical protein BDV25DRAFT_155583 [Aspergillus avenaceus]